MLGMIGVAILIFKFRLVSFLGVLIGLLDDYLEFALTFKTFCLTWFDVLRLRSMLTLKASSLDSLPYLNFRIVFFSNLALNSSIFSLCYLMASSISDDYF